MASTRVITPEATASYPHLTEPQAAVEGQDKKYSIALVFDPGEDLTELKKAVVAAAKEKWGDKLSKAKNGDLIAEQGGKKFTIRVPFRDDAEAKGYAEGSVWFNARSGQKPGVVDQQVKRMDDADVEEKIYPGARVKASLAAFGYDVSGNRGVGFALNNVQLIGDGDRLDSRVAPESEFDAVEPVDLSELEEDTSTDESEDPIEELLS